ncbi:nucleotide exchange factor GrpE [Pseudonocardia spinosispora]|uniref:nucleotide exchange factor GrpE n=1 Tax=Pseudonocardia spinosispora TaxID=103441 RepID=UPI0003FF25BE|nr:nucleotide exchange factor GrpE [Pseudonocardia spinosispora]
MSERYEGPGDRSATSPGEPEPVVVRDRRRIDPLTGEVREPAGAQAPAGDQPSTEPSDEPVVEAEVVADPSEAKLAELTAQLDERTADLQRVSAEYANYRRRSDRDRDALVVSAKAKLAGELLTVLDDVARAEQHGDLTGPFKAVADKLVSTLTSAGLTPFGAQGDEFDPSVHEAVQHSAADDLGSGPTVTVVDAVLRQGYRLGDRVLRPAMVVVIDRNAPVLDAPPDTGAPDEDN